MVISGRDSRFAAAMRSASGRCAHSSASSSAASDCAATTDSPSIPASRARVSDRSSTSSRTLDAAWLTASPRRVSRLVTSTAQPGEPGSSGRICSALAALSSTSSTCWSVSRDRNIASCSSWSSGTDSGGTPCARRNRGSTSTALNGGPWA